MTKKYIEKILAARVYDVAQETPLEPARSLSARLGSAVWADGRQVVSGGVSVMATRELT